MNRHLDDAALLEAYYLEETSTGDTGAHLATCLDCRRRLDEVVALATGNEPVSQPESFWVVQRAEIDRKIAETGRHTPAFPRFLQYAAAAALVALLGGVLMFQPAGYVSQPVVTATTVSVAPPSAEELTVPSDPWESDQLQSFSSMVDWESAIDQPATKGGQS